MNSFNETHDATLRSFVASANDGVTDFPIQNLPFAVFRRAGSNEVFRGGVAIGDQLLDLAALSLASVLSGVAANGCAAAAERTLNRFMAMGSPSWSALRLALSRALRAGSTHEAQVRACLIAQSDVEYIVPAHIGDYTDFYTSVFHATPYRSFVPSGQSAAAELQMGADWLPWARLIHCCVRSEFPAPSGADHAAGGHRARARAKQTYGL